MRLRQLRYFVRVCELGSITRAAAELSIAQPALGLQIRSLEDDFGVVLIERGHRGVVPTAAGQIVMAWARDVVRGEQLIKRAVRQAAGAEPTYLSIGLTPSLTQLIAGKVLEVTAGRYPTGVVKIFEAFSEVLLENVESGQLDLALAFELPTVGRFRGFPVLLEHLYYVCPAAEPHEPISLTDILSGPLALPGKQNSIRQAVEAGAQTLGLPVRVIHEVNSQNAAKEIARRGIAGTVSPLGGLINVGSSEGLRARLIVSPSVDRLLVLARSAKAPHSPFEQCLYSAIYEAVSEMVAVSSLKDAYSLVDSSSQLFRG